MVRYVSAPRGRNGTSAVAMASVPRWMHSAMALCGSIWEVLFSALLRPPYCFSLFSVMELSGGCVKSDGSEGDPSRDEGTSFSLLSLIYCTCFRVTELGRQVVREESNHEIVISTQFFLPTTSLPTCLDRAKKKCTQLLVFEPVHDKQLEFDSFVFVTVGRALGAVLMMTSAG